MNKTTIGHNTLRINRIGHGRRGKGDFRFKKPRFTDEAIGAKLKFVEIVYQIANIKGVTKAQVAIAWILNQNDEIVTIPGTGKIHRLGENLGAYNVDFNKTDLAAIDKSRPSKTIGNRY